jgi:predicted phosphodiesterase
MTFKIGIISDTHGLLRPEAEHRLTGVDHIIHGGDIGRPEIMTRCAASPRLPRSEETWITANGLSHIPKPSSFDWREGRSTFCTI